jgi:cytochrome b pre-mRNA-processing protein 3
MIPPLFRRSPKPTIAALYGAIVAQARAPRFYQDYAVPDTVLGRFDMVLLHVVLVLRRLRAGEPRDRALAQGLFDTFCRDMDHNLREMGISDQGVPIQMRRVGEAFYGRAQAYEAALGESTNEALTQALVRNVYVGNVQAGAAPDRAATATEAAALGAYVRQAAGVLGEQALDALTKGEVRFPEPTPLRETAE